MLPTPMGGMKGIYPAALTEDIPAASPLEGCLGSGQLLHPKPLSGSPKAHESLAPIMTPGTEVRSGHLEMTPHMTPTLSCILASLHRCEHEAVSQEATTERVI